MYFFSPSENNYLCNVGMFNPNKKCGKTCQVLAGFDLCIYGRLIGVYRCRFQHRFTLTWNVKRSQNLSLFWLTISLLRFYSFLYLTNRLVSWHDGAMWRKVRVIVVELRLSLSLAVQLVSRKYPVTPGCWLAGICYFLFSKVFDRWWVFYCQEMHFWWGTFFVVAWLYIIKRGTTSGALCWKPGNIILGN